MTASARHRTNKHKKGIGLDVADEEDVDLGAVELDARGRPKRRRRKRVIEGYTKLFVLDTESEEKQRLLEAIQARATEKINI